MATGVIRRLSSFFREIDYAIETILGRGFPPGPLYALDCPNSINKHPIGNEHKGFSLKDILEDGFLWAVPTKRRSLERRLKRKFGSPEYVWKLHVPKTDILTCYTCGHDYEEGKLCARCYEKAKLETKEMQDAIVKDLGLEPVEKDVVVLYEGEKDQYPDIWKDKRIVEMKKSRPPWFHRNLLEPTSQQPSDSKEVKPSDVE